MPINTSRLFTGFMALALGIFCSLGIANAETLNPEGVNPHAEAPRKRITQKQKQAAADAMKKKKAEIEARKAAATGKKASEAVQDSTPAATDNTGTDKVAK